MKGEEGAGEIRQKQVRAGKTIFEFPTFGGKLLWEQLIQLEIRQKKFRNILSRVETQIHTIQPDLSFRCDLF